MKDAKHARNFELATNSSIILVLLSAANGCTASADFFAEPVAQVQQAESSLDNDEEYSIGVDAPPKRLHPRGKPYYVDISAKGSGCPHASTWFPDVSADGEVFTVRFNEYTLSLDPGRPRIKKGCRLVVRAVSSSNQTFALGAFSSAGHVYLESGMKALPEAGYDFVGDRLRRVGTANDYSGPIDTDYVLQETLAAGTFPPGRPCGRQDSLTIATRLLITNNPRKTGFGYLDATDTNGTLQFRLRSRACN